MDEKGDPPGTGRATHINCPRSPRDPVGNHQGVQVREAGAHSHARRSCLERPDGQLQAPGSARDRGPFLPPYRPGGLCGVVNPWIHAPVQIHGPKGHFFVWENGTKDHSGPPGPSVDGFGQKVGGVVLVVVVVDAEYIRRPPTSPSPPGVNWSDGGQLVGRPPGPPGGCWRPTRGPEGLQRSSAGPIPVE